MAEASSPAATTEAQDLEPAPTTVTVTPPKDTQPMQGLPTRTNFISIEQGIKELREEDKKDALRNSEEALLAELNGLGKLLPEEIAAREAETRAKEEVGDSINWVGRLTEYRAAHPKENGLTYFESSPTPKRFRCTVMIGESIQPFGSSVTFSNKKDAKRYAAKRAVDWLIGNGFMPKDGSVKFGKPKVSSIGPVVPSGPSAAAQVPELCHKLGLINPTYKIEKQGNTGNVYSGYATFDGVAWIEGKIGEFANVLGRKQAKEACAQRILVFLKGIQRQKNNGASESESSEEGDAPTARSGPQVVSPAPQPHTPSTPISSSNPSPNPKAPAATMVPELCIKLGFRMPTYIIEKVNDENLPLYDGYAHFDGDPRLPLKIGAFSGVYGKKQAKEKCAEMVLEALGAVEKERTANHLPESSLSVREAEPPAKRKRSGEDDDGLDMKSDKSAKLEVENT
ncbi:hypothetical protein BP5796_04903 [Coleophoma crateriformis]|uniref:DRBM domain-containing protein n=1 Tax=Coleophoma crateriformis TaxID=565419 RepID=A0A3D8SAL4_9HELO|nr:hypothetical protein BP5796_04903 [Coleophoma crateriformis]